MDLPFVRGLSRGKVSVDEGYGSKILQLTCALSNETSMHHSGTIARLSESHLEMYVLSSHDIHGSATAQTNAAT